MAAAFEAFSYSFDVTSILQQLARNGVRAPDTLLLTIIPGGWPNSKAQPLIASIELIRK